MPRTPSGESTGSHQRGRRLGPEQAPETRAMACAFRRARALRGPLRELESQILLCQLNPALTSHWCSGRESTQLQCLWKEGLWEIWGGLLFCSRGDGSQLLAGRLSGAGSAVLGRSLAQAWD